MVQVVITGGSYPKQRAAIEYGKLFIKDQNRESLVYTLRAAVSDLQTVSEGRGNRTVKISLRDEKAIVCTVTRAIYDHLYQEMVTGPREGDAIVSPEISSQKIARGLLRYAGAFTMVFLLGLCTFEMIPPNDPNRIPSAERRKIEDMYYITGTSPSLSDADRKSYRCRESGRLASYYDGLDDKASAKEWRDINRRECQY